MISGRVWHRNLGSFARRRRPVALPAVALVLALTACGSGGGGVNSTPAPAPTPSPTPTPVANAPFGLSKDQQFATTGTIREGKSGSWDVVPTEADAVEFRWSQTAKAYEVKLPGYQTGRLQQWTSNPTVNDVIASGSKLPASVSIPETATLSYTHYAYWRASVADGGGNFNDGLFAYGIPTAAGDVPTSGTATYSATVIGQAASGIDSAGGVSGTAQLAFDFGAGSLSGHMDVNYADGLGIGFTLPRYDFTQTVYASGSTSFSGKFKVGGSPVESFFEGSFNGPKAAELMARWQATFINPNDNTLDAMSGIWVGKKQ